MAAAYGWMLTLAGGRSWVFRSKSPLTGKERYMGLGAAPNGITDAARKSLADAREAADRVCKLLRDGKDPIEHRNEVRNAARVEAAKAISFKDYADQSSAPTNSGGRIPSIASNGATRFAIVLIPSLARRPSLTSRLMDFLCELREAEGYF